MTAEHIHGIIPISVAMADIAPVKQLVEETWKTVREEIDAVTSDSASWTSDRKHLLEIIEWAQRRGLKPKGNGMNVSNLRETIKEARRAIRNEDNARMQVLIDLAEGSTVSELRRALGKTRHETILVKARKTGRLVSYQMVVTKDQLEVVRKATERRLCFVEKS